MVTRAKTAVLAFSLATLLAAPFAEAAKLGKSKSFGMKRSTPSQSYQQPAPMQPAQPMAPAQQPRKGPGLGTAVAAGAAGAAAGYMLGSAMSDSSSGASESGSGMPWGTLAMLGLLFAGGMMLFRRRAAHPAAPAMRMPQPAGPYAAPQPAPAPAPAQFGGIPKIGSGLAGGAAAVGAPAFSGQRLPDGTETAHFLRQAKATFMHLQSLNSADNVDEISKYMTPEMFAEIRAEILANHTLADFPQLDCQLVDAATEGGRHIASVRFTGTVSEEVGAPAQPFSETWHYIKEGNSPRWLLAGIQQD